MVVYLNQDYAFRVLEVHYREDEIPEDWDADEMLEETGYLENFAAYLKALSLIDDLGTNLVFLDY